MYWHRSSVCYTTTLPPQALLNLFNLSRLVMAFGVQAPRLLFRSQEVSIQLSPQAPNSLPGLPRVQVWDWVGPRMQCPVTPLQVHLPCNHV